MSGRAKWAIIAVVGVLATLGGAYSVIGPRDGLCRPPLLEMMRDDPTKSAARVDLADGLDQPARQAVRKKLTQVDGVISVRTPTQKTFLVTSRDTDGLAKIEAVVAGDASVVSVAALPAEDPRIKKCNDDATTQLAIGAPLLIIGLAVMIFGILRYHRAGMAALPEEGAAGPAEEPPPPAE